MNEENNKDIHKNIPIEGEFMKKCYNDLIYGYMQVNSYKGFDKQEREVYFIYKTPSTIKEISSFTKIHGRTVRRKVEALIKGGFIEEGKIWNVSHDKLVDCYIIKKINTYYQKIDKNTLKYLSHTANECVIKVYAYLLNKCNNINEHYEFTYKELIINCLGMESFSNKRDYERIKDILVSLRNNELVYIEKKKRVKYIDGVKTFYFVVEKINLDYKK